MCPEARGSVRGKGARGRWVGALQSSGLERGTRPPAQGLPKRALGNGQSGVALGSRRFPSRVKTGVGVGGWARRGRGWARLSPGGQLASAVVVDSLWEAGLKTAPTEGFPLKNGWL